MDGDRLLGEFLRARRHATSPDQVGLSAGRRRTPGLRREEVAMLAGVSSEYYTRLEQGRERRPSEQVLEALARVFDLDAEAVDHLFELTRPRPRRRTSGQISPNLLRLMAGWDHLPALILNDQMDLLAQNPPAAALHEGLLEPLGNVIRMTFLNPASRDFYVDWEREARSNAAHLRTVAGGDPQDPRLLALIEELLDGSEDFRRLWTRYEVGMKVPGTIRIRHRRVGELTLHFEALAVRSAPGQYLVLGQAEPGASEHAVAGLRNGRAGGRETSRAASFPVG
ncbi:helix-turn-helix transcriptional regulator [Microbispora corallina]|nr:helix-turn-helix transcriptional regulator [Microbispora corallina]